MTQTTGTQATGTQATVPYVERAPGDLLTAEDWNAVQRQIRDDIRDTAQQAADGVTHVATADDAEHLEGKDLATLSDEVTKRVLDAVRGRTGYQQLFKILREPDGADIEPSVIEHGLGTAPLVDVYELAYFQVVCREDDETRATFATFYLHHSSERRVRVPGGPSVDVQPRNFPQWGIPFADMLARYDVEYTDTTSLDDLETEFWQAFFAEPNDQFGDDQYCHSPWFERCCKEQQSVRQLKQKGDWDDMWFQMRPRKTVNFPAGPVLGNGTTDRQPAPANVAVAHLDNNRAALWLAGPAVHTVPDIASNTADGDDDPFASYLADTGGADTLKVMVLLKV